MMSEGSTNSIPVRRSPCPVACTLDLLGDRWSLLVIRDLFLGKSRFKDFSQSPEGVPTNILSDRLKRLMASGVIDQVPAQKGGRQFAYRLTDKGRALLPVLRELFDWGTKWIEGTSPRLGSAAVPNNAI